MVLMNRLRTWYSRLIKYASLQSRKLSALSSIGDLFGKSVLPKAEVATTQKSQEPQAPFLQKVKSPLLIPLAAYVSVVIPALNEAKRIADVVAYALADTATSEVIVIDDSSIDDTVKLAEQAGARVITSNMLGKGGSMQDGVALAKCDYVLYLDGDLSGLRAGIITDLCRPLLNSEADFVKARFGRGGGRVTVLTAKPMMQIFFPELAHFAQPLGGIIAARKSLLQSLRFEDGYGVDVALLIDASLAGATLVEVDIGSLEHDSQPLLDLGVMANEVGRVIFNRAREAGRLHVEQITAMYESQRQAASDIDYVLTRRKGRQRLLLLEMDSTVTMSNFDLELARATGLEEVLLQLKSSPLFLDSHATAQAEAIAKVFRFIHKQKFEETARTLELRFGLIEFVNQMRRRGFMVGVVSGGYFVAAEIIRRRIFADFAMANNVVFDSEVCSGQVRINPAFLPDADLADDAENALSFDKSHMLQRFLRDVTQPTINLSWVIGDPQNGATWMRLSDRAFTINASQSALPEDPPVTSINAFSELLAFLPNYEIVENGIAENI